MRNDGKQTDFFPAAFYSLNPEMFDLLEKAIAGLAGSVRLVFTLYFYEGLALPEIASVLEETPLAVLQLHLSALDHLKARLEDAEKQAGEAEQARKPS